VIAALQALLTYRSTPWRYMPHLACHQEGHRVGEHQEVYCSVYWGPGIQPVQMSGRQLGQACFCSFVLDGHRRSPWSEATPDITEGWLLPTWRNEHNSIPCIIIVLQIHSFHSEAGEILALVFTKAYEICNLCCLVLMPLLLLWTCVHFALKCESNSCC